jgi:hemin uptake protein HemP
MAAAASGRTSVTIRPEPDQAMRSAAGHPGGMQDLHRIAEPRANADAAPETSADHDDAAEPAPAIASAALLGRARELMILHGEDTYRLRLTRHGKLILTK